MKPSILLLLHQGKSFTHDVREAAEKHGLALVGLSSRPKNAEVLDDTQRLLADCLVTDGPQLGPDDIKDVVERLAERGYAIEAVVATFEGYRLLMATLNQQLGARDSSVRAIELCLNKYTLRQFLFDRGLSTVQSHLLNGADVPHLDPSTRWFVKPVRGASSFAAFILDDVRTLQDLPQLQEQMRNDERMAAIFMDQYDFLVEEYIAGPEFSFEVLAVDEAHHMCIHEKAIVDRLDRTTLESMSISPPVCVGLDVISRGAEYVSRCFAELRSYGLTAGAFHVEAKYWADKDQWEIIEINPRMGGSLINASVRALIGESMLDLWVESLLLPEEGLDAFRARLESASQLTAMSKGAALKATVFLSKYGKKGATIDSIAFEPDARKPDKLNLHVSAGTTLDDSDRAICLMDALWEVDPNDLAEEVRGLDRHATEHFHVTYL
jgi:hypothetical protein